MNKKKLIAVVLAALMSISGSTVAFADNSSAAGSGSAAVVLENSDAEVVVTNATGLENALEAGGKVKLGGDITMDTRYDIAGSEWMYNYQELWKNKSLYIYRQRRVTDD